MFAERVTHTPGSWGKEKYYSPTLTLISENECSVGPGVQPYGFTLGSGGAAVTCISANDKARARTECILKVKGGGVALGENLGDSRHTVHMLSSKVKSFAGALLSARRGNWAEAGRRLGIDGWSNSKSWANGWLEYQYGWKPLMSDIYDTQQLLKTGFKNNDQLFSASRQLSFPIDSEKFKPSFDANAKVSGDASAFFRVKVWGKVNNAQLLALNSLGLVNPVSLAWELTPYSFVVDWFLPIGNFLDGLTSTLGVTFRGGIESSGLKYKITSTRTLATGETGSAPSATYEVYVFQRTGLTGWPQSVPYWKNPFTSPHVVSAMALLRQLR